MSNFNHAFKFDARKKSTHFRILVIGRANAGKTTLLKRVCNTTEEPYIDDEQYSNLLEPTKERGIHDINRPFVFASNPQLIFHDSPGFESGDEQQLKEVKDFIEKCAKSTEVNDRLHAIWFCFTPDVARPLLGLEQRFFNDGVAGNVPVIAIFTKFDDLIAQVYDMDMGEEENRNAASEALDDAFEMPLRNFAFPPRAYIRLEALHHDDGNHQEQVKALIEKTAMYSEEHRAEEEKRRREEEEQRRHAEQEQRRRAEQEERRRAEEAVDGDGWGEWEGIDIEPPKQNIREGAGESEMDDRKEEAFEAKEEADVAKSEDEKAETEKWPDDREANAGNRNSKELEAPKEVQVVVDENIEKAGQEGQENEKSRWGIPLKDEPAIILPQQKESCCGCMVM